MLANRLENLTCTKPWAKASRSVSLLPLPTVSSLLSPIPIEFNAGAQIWDRCGPGFGGLPDLLLFAQAVSIIAGQGRSGPGSSILLGTSFLPAPSVTFAVATDAKRNQVVHQIVTKPAPGVHMMDLQALHGTTLLAPPTISLQDLDSEFRVLFRAQFKPGSPLT
jgi:hypothetical protein